MTGGEGRNCPEPPEAVFRDPAPDRSHPALTLAQAIPSGGVNLNAVLYTAAGRGPHPTVLLLHGLPGNEQNLDLAQSMRRAGWNVLTLHYRGSWGTPGTFSFEHCLVDARAAFAWLLRAQGDPALRIDPGGLVVMGHSMGGFVAAHLAASCAPVLGLALISPANIGTSFGQIPRNAAINAIDDNVGTSEGLHILAGTSPEALAKEVSDNADDWQLENGAPVLARQPLLLITSDDGFSVGSNALAQALNESPWFSRAHFPTDHSYSDHRIGLQVAVLLWLERLLFR